jgi:hypothetical protein
MTLVHIMIFIAGLARFAIFGGAVWILVHISVYNFRIAQKDHYIF